MTLRLPPVLTWRDLPTAELHAARLDGELFPVNGCFSPIDEPDTAALRARSLAATLPGRMIAEQRTAAWILGAIAMPPTHHQLCTDISARARPAAMVTMTVREVVIEDHELIALGGMRVTTPLRTAVDIARSSEHFMEEERRIVAALSTIGGFRLRDCLDAIESRRNLPQKHRASSRLASALAGQPALTRYTS